MTVEPAYKPQAREGQLTQHCYQTELAKVSTGHFNQTSRQCNDDDDVTVTCYDWQRLYSLLERLFLSVVPSPTLSY